MTDVRLDKICKTYGTVEVLKDIDLSIEDGEFCVFVGPSGCGKSTLLRMIAGLEEITSGDLSIGDRRVNSLSPKERGIAMVFQSYALYPHRTVRGNMEFGLKLSRMDRREIDARIARAAKMLQIEPLLDRRPAQLSGGQRQRVAIGRAIVRDPTVFLFDEPLSNLDAALRVETRREIAALHEKLGTTMIYVTHDQVEAMTLADKIVVLNDGAVQQVGTPLELYDTPANLFVAGFIGSPRMNLFAGEAGPEGIVTASFGTLPRPDGPLPEGNVTIGIRPENLHLTSEGGARARVTLVEHLGNEILVELALADGQKAVAQGPRNHCPTPGDSVGVTIGSEPLHLFDGLGRRIETRSP
ncbi:ABC transporter ATP-binding protein [Frigidibacter sp. ROC022]|uniref:ABC transporter ATP-binding protein n=1 Tax=Frigidibacter sp. ROC022 TaxID=2971796 RepID=UPI00215B2405|nr:sn-glycerol-3-phosphate ABC transporter ATP-binding protein UgpC [Frigidibacter sp. ROC022]MCR8724624.1 sn-glycerol-3-phosphate ABC transporter ATP-binding protein UgpC [Frigidibacter sp. ROC022]